MPTHHFVEDYVDMIRRMVEIVGVAKATALRIFGHDMLSAYRQWPVCERTALSSGWPSSLSCWPPDQADHARPRRRRRSTVVQGHR